MIKLYKKTLILSFVAGAGILSLNYSSGPALNFVSATGGSFGTYGSGTFCSYCHSGGSFNTNATTIQLLSNGVPVTGNYVPGWTYTLRINRGTNASHTLTPNSGFGFQITCVTNSTNTNINTWGTPLPANTANRTLSSRNYIEHTTKLSSSITQVNIPWTAPTGNVGTVKFHLALNNVNGNGQNTGDHPYALTATFNQAPLPVTWLYFRGRENGTANLLEWAVSHEADNDFYTVEKSVNGVDFAELGSIKASHDPVAIHTYTLADAAPYEKTYYRIKQTDVNGVESYYNTIFIVRPTGTTLTHYLTSDKVNLKITSDRARELTATIYSIDGRTTIRTNILLNIGENYIPIDKPQFPGIYFLSVTDYFNQLYQAKFLNSL